MKTVLIFLFCLFYLTALKSFSIEDSCLYLKYLHCPQFGYWNVNLAMNNQCNYKDNSLYIKKTIRLVFNDIIINLEKHPEGTKLYYDYEHVCLLLKAENKFPDLISDLKRGFDKFGNFWFVREYFKDSNALTGRTFYLEFDNYQNLDSIQNYFESISNLYDFYYESSPWEIPESFWFSVNEIKFLNYPEFYLRVPESRNYTEPFSSWNFVVFKKTESDSQFKEIDLRYNRLQDTIENNSSYCKYYYFKDSLTKPISPIITYRICVSGTSGICSGLCQNIYFRTTDIDDHQLKNEFLDNNIISPNPATDYIEISLGVQQAIPLQIRIYDVFGREVKNPITTFMLGEGDSKHSSSQYSILNTQYPTKIDVSSLTPGLYFVRVGGRVGKFMKY